MYFNDKVLNGNSIPDIKFKCVFKVYQRLYEETFIHNLQIKVKLLN